MLLQLCSYSLSEIFLFRFGANFHSKSIIFGPHHERTRPTRILGNLGGHDSPAKEGSRGGQMCR
jgi:hypothetical protein